MKKVIALLLVATFTILASCESADKVTNAVKDGADNVTKTVNTAGDAVKETADTVKETADTVKDAGSTVVDAVKGDSKTKEETETSNDEK